MYTFQVKGKLIQQNDADIQGICCICYLDIGHTIVMSTWGKYTDNHRLYMNDIWNLCLCFWTWQFRQMWKNFDMIFLIACKRNLNLHHLQKGTHEALIQPNLASSRKLCWLTWLTDKLCFLWCRLSAKFKNYVIRTVMEPYNNLLYYIKPDEYIRVYMSVHNCVYWFNIAPYSIV